MSRLAWSSTEVVGSQCSYCVHRLPGNPQTCPAFPEGMPADIEANLFDHRNPHPDEEAPVRFEPRAGADPEELDRLRAALDAL